MARECEPRKPRQSKNTEPDKAEIVPATQQEGKEAPKSAPSEPIPEPAPKAPTKKKAPLNASESLLTGNQRRREEKRRKAKEWYHAHKEQALAASRKRRAREKLARHSQAAEKAKEVLEQKTEPSIK